MSFFQLESIDQSASRYLDVLGLVSQAKSKNCECTLLLCVASRLFPGHNDQVRATIEPRTSELRERPGFKAVHDVWNGPFNPDTHPWQRIAGKITWRGGLSAREIQTTNWVENLEGWSSLGEATPAKWSDVASHVRNALAHGGARWIPDARSPSEREDGGRESIRRIGTETRKLDIGKLVLASETKSGSGEFRACCMSVTTFEDMLREWLRVIQASKLRTSISDLNQELLIHQQAA